jgi:hypothetical protein
MTDFNRYWAEDAIGEPYTPQDYRWMKSYRRAGMLLGGVTCVLTTGALLGAAVYHLVDPAPRVSISSYEIAMPAAQRPAPAQAQPKRSPISNKELGSQTPPDLAQGAAARKSDLSHGAAAAPAVAAAKAEHSAKGATADAGTVPAQPQAKTQLAATNSAPGPAAGSARTGADRNAAGSTAADKHQQTKPADPAPPIKPEADTRIGLSKTAESKPADIASGEKLGIREVLPDGIVMQNGRRIKNGSSLPNGEMLMGTDATKGMVETDRRVLVLTP